MKKFIQFYFYLYHWAAKPFHYPKEKIPEPDTTDLVKGGNTFHATS